ncbi:MAG: ABC transporter ATP-binding protein [Deltaproteobacteria bacterium]|nr:ABC transporter ATP-binding protein [Deltaproteobacteria bacterium]
MSLEDRYEGTGEMSEEYLEFQGVTKRFGQLEAVKDLSFRVSHGTFFSLIGPSGCGKTTTLRMVAGFESASEGRILIDGEDISPVPPNKRNISMVFQHFALFPHMNVFKNVEYGLRMRKVPKEERVERVRQALALLEIDDIPQEPATRISGGQQQKVGLARALVTEPKILLLDEPMGSIDEDLRIRTQREVRRLFERLKITFIHVTHSQAEAFSMADRVMVMNEGRLVQDDSPEEIFRAPANDFVARFVGRNNIFYGQVASFSGGGAEIKTPLGLFCIETERPIPAAGERTSFSVRSDLMTISDEQDQEAANGLEVEITFIEAIKNLKVYHLLGADETVFKVERHGLNEDGGPSIGQRVWLSWKPAEAVLLECLSR